jgi:hypothetical protein
MRFCSTSSVASGNTPIQRAAQLVPGGEKQLVGHRVLRPLEGWLRALHEQPAHANRSLFADHLLVAHLVAFLSPALKSLRRIEEIFNHTAARKRFDLPRVPRSALSDAQALFDPALLDPIIADLRARVPVLPHEPALDALLKKLTAVDGSFFALAPRVAWALYNKPKADTGLAKGSTRSKPSTRRKGNIRVDVHFNVLSGVPEQAILSDGRTPEYQTLVDHLLAGHFYVLDRAYHCYQMMADILAAESDFLVRLRADMLFEVLEEHVLSAADRLAGVLSVQTVRTTGHRGRSALGDTPLQLVCIAQAEGEPLRLLTSRIDLDAGLIGMVYRYRWQIELFFRWLKCLVNFRHFFSESPEGVALQIGAAVIGTLLIALTIQDKPSSYDWAMISHVINGLIPLDQETFQIMAARRKQRARAAETQKVWRARQKTSR